MIKLTEFTDSGDWILENTEMVLENSKLINFLGFQSQGGSINLNNIQFEELGQEENGRRILNINSEYLFTFHEVNTLVVDNLIFNQLSQPLFFVDQGDTINLNQIQISNANFDSKNIFEFQGKFFFVFRFFLLNIFIFPCTLRQSLMKFHLLSYLCVVYLLHSSNSFQSVFRRGLSL